MQSFFSILFTIRCIQPIKIDPSFMERLAPENCSYLLKNCQRQLASGISHTQKAKKLKKTAPGLAL